MSAALLKLSPAPGLVEQAYRALVDAITSGALAPGARLTQDELAQRLAVSRQPVLQALRLLKADGLVQDAPGRGLQVAPLEAAQLAQVYAVRGALDGLAAGLAAERRVALAPALLRRGRAAAAGRDVKAMIDADVDFHRALYAAAGNPLIERSAAPHWCQIRRAMGAVLQAGSVRAAVWDEHAAIAAAVAAGDAEAATTLACEHARSAGEQLGRAYAALHPGATPRTAGDTR